MPVRKWSRYLVGVVAIAGWLALVVSAGAETCKLETKRLDATLFHRDFEV